MTEAIKLIPAYYYDGLSIILPNHPSLLIVIIIGIRYFIRKITRDRYYLPLELDVEMN